MVEVLSYCGWESIEGRYAEHCLLFPWAHNEHSPVEEVSTIPMEFSTARSDAGNVYQ